MDGIRPPEDNVVPFKRPNGRTKGPPSKRVKSTVHFEPGLPVGPAMQTLGLYKPGQNIICKIVAQVPGGYEAVIPKDGYAAFLPSEQSHVPGKEVLAHFVCFDKMLVLLSERFIAGASGKVIGNRSWLHQVDNDEPED